MRDDNIRSRIAYLKQQERARMESKAPPEDRDRILGLMRKVGLHAYRCGLMHRMIADQAGINQPGDRLLDDWVYGLTEDEGRRLLRALRARLSDD